MNNDKLFFKIFRNQYIRSEISKHIRLYSLHWSKSYRDSLNNAKYKTYVTRFLAFMFRKKINTNNFPELSVIKFNYKFNKEIAPGSLPDTIKEIYFNFYDRKLLVGSIPHGVKVISFGESYSHPITDNILPDSVIKLSITPRSNISQIMVSLQLTELELHSYNIEFTIGQLPDTIKILKIKGYCQKFNVNCLPLSLKELYCPTYKEIIEVETFSKNINLKKIIFGLYDREIKEFVLPLQLVQLELGCTFNQHINRNVLPDTIKTLHFGTRFKSDIYSWPNSLTSLKFDCRYFRSPCIIIPPLPPTLTELDLRTCTFLDEKLFLKLIKFSDSITSFSLPDFREGKLRITKEMMPVNTKNLTISNSKISYISLVPSITSIRASYNFDWSIIKLINGLEELVFNQVLSFNDPISLKFPIPNTLKKLEFSWNWFNGGIPITQGQLPNSIEVLKFGNLFKQVLTLDILPTSLKVLKCFNHCNTTVLKSLKKHEIKFKIINHNNK